MSSVAVETGFSDLLRWILLLIGAAVVFGVYLFSRRSSNRADADDSRAHAASNDVVDDAQSDPSPDESPSAAQMPAGESDEKRLLVLHVRAMDGHKFSGGDILRIAERAKLKCASGDGGGFFEYFDEQRAQPDLDIEPQPLFYVANMFSPGLFDFRQMGSFSTTGLSLFAQLPGVLPADEVFGRLLAHARLFAEGLQGSVIDENHNEITSRSIQAMRDTFRSSAE